MPRRYHRVPTTMTPKKIFLTIKNAIVTCLTGHQRDFLFLQLPPEIRNMIYKEVFRDTTWFVYRKLPQLARVKASLGAINLLYTCRQIYTEAGLFPYRYGTFHIGFLVGTIAHDFLQNRTQIQLQTIRILRGDELLSGSLRFLDKLPNLEQVEMMLQGNHFLVQIKHRGRRVEVHHFTHQQTGARRNDLRLKLKGLLQGWKQEAKIVFMQA
ncbi:hypothetical protein BKA66DRAFT_34522 [Pyrenochaeta sp. MPI-SDFR-AT-0127]|nr:hypothetical protein BKA66DRAFT_34522 [Pyrenochaeta sp. MPI-SDFR-AT-0127]